MRIVIVVGVISLICTFLCAVIKLFDVGLGREDLLLLDDEVGVQVVQVGRSLGAAGVVRYYLGG